MLVDWSLFKMVELVFFGFFHWHNQPDEDETPESLYIFFMK
jgi:hypothetical protein